MKTINIMISRGPEPHAKYRLGPFEGHAERHYLDTFNNIHQAREFVRLLNRKVDEATAIKMALGQPEDTPLYSLSHVTDELWEMEIDGDPVGTANSHYNACRLLGTLRLHKVRNDICWEKLPAAYRDMWKTLTHSDKPVFWMKESA